MATTGVRITPRAVRAQFVAAPSNGVEKIALTNDRTDWTETAIVTVRVPRNADTDLATDAQRRLGRIDGVSEVSVDGFRGIEPQLSATAMTVAVTIDRTVAVAELRDRFANATSVETVEHPDVVEP